MQQNTALDREDHSTNNNSHTAYSKEVESMMNIQKQQETENTQKTTPSAKGREAESKSRRGENGRMKSTTNEWGKTEKTPQKTTQSH